MKRKVIELVGKILSAVVFSIMDLRGIMLIDRVLSEANKLKVLLS